MSEIIGIDNRSDGWIPFDRAQEAQVYRKELDGIYMKYMHMATPPVFTEKEQERLKFLTQKLRDIYA